MASRRKDQAGTGRTPSGQFAPGRSGNPSGRPPGSGREFRNDAADPAVIAPTAQRQVRADSYVKGGQREVRSDGYVNAWTGHGTRRDRRTATRFQTSIVRDLTAIDMRRGNWLAGRICEWLPEEGFRRGFDLKLPKKDQATKAMSMIQQLQLDTKFRDAVAMERTVGGSALFPVLEGAVGDLSEPLDLDSKTPGITKLSAVHLFEARELMPLSWYTDVTNPKFGRPEVYRLFPLNVRGGVIQIIEVHETRLAVFPGKHFTREFLPGQRLGWGDSVLTRPAEVLADVGLSWGSAATILHNFTQRVLKLDQLADILKEADGERLVQKRADVMAMVSGVLGMMPIDSKDELVNLTTSVAGLADLLNHFMVVLAAAADMTVTRLFGTSAKGLDATGENDVRGDYDRVGNEQSRWTPLLEWLIRLLLLSTDGPTGGIEPDVWSIGWRPLWTPSEKEEAERRYIVAQTDQIYYNIGSASSDDIAESRWDGDEYSAEMRIDWKARAEQAKAQEVQAAKLDAAAVAALGRQPQQGQQPTATDAKPTSDTQSSAPARAPAPVMDKREG